uniref:THAP-type domain-containing protein n=3 Tax=Anopheles marajoara TaxID=58244 RepID=A0A2M4BJI0_9DIPT
MGKISGSHCLVLGCRNRQLLNQTNTRSYFRFPRDADLCKKWVDFCNRPELYKKYDENGPEYLYKSSRICSDHFQPNDFNNPNLYSQGLKKGSIPTVNPASKEPKSASSPLNGVTTVTGNGAGGGGGGGSGSSNGTGSPIDEKLLTAAVASMAAGGTQLPADHLSLFYAAAIAAAAQAQAANNHHSVPLNLKRTAPQPTAAAAGAATNNNNNNSLQSSGVTSATSATTTTSTTPPAATGGGGGPVSAKRNRAVPPLATPTGALANLIQRQQQIKEQQRKAAAAAAAALASANQVSITPTSGAGGGGGGVTTPAARAPHSLVPIHGTTTTTTTSSNGSGGGGAPPPPSKRPTLNNNNSSVSNNNHNHHSQNQKPSLLGKRSSREDGNGSGSDYGINMMDIDMLSGAESSEGDSSNGPASADEEYAAYRRQLKKVTRKVEEVIPLALKSQLTVTPANLGSSGVSSTTAASTSPTSRSSATTTTINNNSIHNVNANGGSPDGLVDYKQKYELTLKELFACRKIVKNQNKAMKQLQGEIDFLNLLLKEK